MKRQAQWCPVSKLICLVKGHTIPGRRVDEHTRETVAQPVLFG